MKTLKTWRAERAAKKQAERQPLNAWAPIYCCPVKDCEVFQHLIYPEPCIDHPDYMMVTLDEDKQ